MSRYVLYLYKSLSIYHYISRRLDISCEIRCWQVDMPFTPQTVGKRHGTHRFGYHFFCQVTQSAEGRAAWTAWGEEVHIPAAIWFYPIGPMYIYLHLP